MYKIVKNNAETKLVEVNGKEVEIPVDWEVKKLGEISNRLINGKSFNSENFNEDGVGFPLIRIRNILKQETNTYCDSERDDNYKIYYHDILIGMDGDFNVVLWNKNEDFYLNQRVALISFNDKNLNFYSYLYIQPIIQSIHKKTSFTTVKHLSINTLRDIDISFPLDYLKMKTISNFLYKMENTISETEELISSMEKRLRYYVRELTTGRLRIKKDGEQINLVENEHFKTVEVNGKDMEIPVDWEVKEISKIITSKVGYSFSKEYFDINGDYPIIRMSDFKEGKISIQKSIRVNTLPKNSDNFLIMKNDILLGMSGSIDNISRFTLDDTAYLNQRVCKLTGQKYILDYIFYILISDIYKKYINKLVSKSVIGNISEKNITNFQIPFSRIPREQEQIASLLKREADDIEQMKELLAMQKKRFKWAMSELLSGRYVLEKIEEN